MSLSLAPSESIEELARCACCRLLFDGSEHTPKLLECQHHFCLACLRAMLGADGVLYCVYCWQRTAPVGGHVECLPTHGPVLALAARFRRERDNGPRSPDGPECCPTHLLPLLWCATCSAPACRICDCAARHPAASRPVDEARALVLRDSRDLHADMMRLASWRRDTKARALAAISAFKLLIESELAAPEGEPEPESLPLLTAAAERERLRRLHTAALLRHRLEDATRNATGPLDFELLATAMGAAAPAPAGADATDPLLFLTNYCFMRLFLRSLDATTIRAAPRTLYYFYLELDGRAAGRVVIAVREDAAPRMSRNFSLLATGELGVGYRGCCVFQCWEAQSVITGDFEYNNGRGGRSVFGDAFFLPDVSRLPAVRGAVGMRRARKQKDCFGLVGSQFRIVLQDLLVFSAIFGSVVEGIELLDGLSQTGDEAGRPRSNIIISSCGRLA